MNDVRTFLTTAAPQPRESDPVTAVLGRYHHRQRTRRRVGVLGAAAAAVVAAGLAVSGPLHSAAGNTLPAGPASTPTTGPSAARSPIPSASPTAATAPAATAPAQNLQVSAAVRGQLVAAFTAGRRLPADDVSGTRPGSVYYGYQPFSRTYWAVADLMPSQTALQRSQGAPDGGPLAQFQDGPWVFTRPASGGWRLVTDTGGTLCPGVVPAAVLAVWQLPAPEGCPTR